MPVEEVLELHLKLAFAIEDLRTLLSVDDVLGAIWFTEKELRVDVRRRPAKRAVAPTAGHPPSPPRTAAAPDGGDPAFPIVSGPMAGNTGRRSAPAPSDCTPR